MQLGRCHEAAGDVASAIATYEQAAEGCAMGAASVCRLTGRISGAPATLAAHLSAWTRVAAESEAAALKLNLALMQACDPAGTHSPHLPRPSLPRKNDSNGDVPLNQFCLLCLLCNPANTFSPHLPRRSLPCQNDTDVDVLNQFCLLTLMHDVR